jgi:hypothetical protein
LIQKHTVARLKAGTKDEIVGGKYYYSEAVRQLYDVLENFYKYTKIKLPEQESKDKPV